MKNPESSWHSSLHCAKITAELPLSTFRATARLFEGSSVAPSFCSTDPPQTSFASVGEAHTFL